MTKSDYKFFEKARNVAMLSNYIKAHVGCIAVYHDSVIGTGCNSNKTHPAQQYYNRYRIKSEFLLPKLHAEIDCTNSIKNFNINFSKVKLYIYRIRMDQSFGMASPCPSCMAAIKDLEFKICIIQQMTNMDMSKYRYLKGVLHNVYDMLA